MQEETLMKQVEELAQKEKMEIYKISAATKQGIEELIDYVEKNKKERQKRKI